MRLIRVNNHQLKRVRGTNQHKVKYGVTLKRGNKAKLFVGLTLAYLTFVGSVGGVKLAEKVAPVIFPAPIHFTFKSPLSLPSKAFADERIASSSAALNEKDTPTPSVSPYNSIRQEISEVFGSDASKAFKLLDCENHSLNPLAVNDNTTWGGVGQDIGVFQINTVWQGVSNKAFLFDSSINIRIAHNIYTRDGHSFKLWTCGRNLGL